MFHYIEEFSSPRLTRCHTNLLPNSPKFGAGKMRLEMLAFEAVLLLHLVCSISSDVVQVPSTINLNSYLGEGRCISGTGQCLEMWLRRYDWEGILWSARKAASVRREMIHGLDPNSCTCGWATLVCWSPLVNHDYHDYPSSKLPGRQQQPQKWEVVSLKLGKKKYILLDRIQHMGMDGYLLLYHICLGWTSICGHIQNPSQCILMQSSCVVPLHANCHVLWLSIHPYNS